MPVRKLLKRSLRIFCLMIAVCFAFIAVSGCAEKPPRSEKTSYYLQKIKEAPGNPVNFTNLGWTLYKEGDLQEAVKWNQKALQINKNNLTARYNLALIYFDQKDFPKSKQELTAILRLQPNDPLALLKLGETNLKLNKYEEARLAFKTYLKQDMTSANALKGLGDSYVGLGQVEKAVFSFKLALKYVPDYQEAKKALKILEDTKP
ncbi:MAG: tetratricopeptide repeat protein [Eubacteriales bacterium]